MSFSPLQVGYIANTITPVPAGGYVKAALDLFDQKPDLEVVPIAGEDGTVLGVVSRKITANFAVSAVYRGYQKNLKDFLIPFRGILEGRDFISRIVDKNLKIDQGEYPAWFAIHHNRRYLGIVSLQYMLEYINTLRSQDMKTAGEIQKNILGKSVPQDSRFRLFFYNQMAHEIGGDYYHVFSNGTDRYLIGCFDVSGKNIAGSMAAMALGACFSTLELFKYHETPEKITRLLNSLIKDVAPLGYFVAAVLFHIDFSSKALVIHNCGFSPVSVFKPLDDKKIGHKILEPGLPPLGIEETLDLNEGQIVPIVEGLRISTYSDGFTDMTNSFGERFGEEKTGDVLKKLHHCSREQMKINLDREIRQWIGEASLADDLTLMDLRF
ncbi:MAG: SpoIIE family protein phosphatase [Treponema sp.]|jgi:sigma-B regulation protein RsbU (phosphoserine phosphatase)|nr:SpoIIE family protein phosphatase [Treponema sp.]